jgi:hypothetical protein
MGRDRRALWVGGCTWLLGALASGCGSGPALRYEEFYTSNGEERALGDGCMLAEEGISGSMATGVAGGAGDPMQPYTVEYEGLDGGIMVTITDGGGKVQARRVYDEAFLESGKSDEIVVDLEMDTLRLRYFGAESCDPAG